ncbi:choice-of-anchor I family protein [Actinotalea sp. M2MS4P-6]|uniref:choice-of-anchor I family protein n=1 Tax=Actinotalea sp. M2MS4P-6 TaxID=2983762 RepID=UPI0021E48177|nr:choice-of-anchor I family protein [Actinotalea sp. M2MS4P-6]MCV2392709.1 choice-of-anchor I family protein [Actinotalea sp. M2MS4P-6]
MRSVLRRAGVGLGSVALCVGGAGVASAADPVPDPITYSAPGARLAVTPTASYETGIFDESAQEIVAYHARTNRLFTVNAQLGRIEVIDASAMSKVGEIDTAGVEAADGSSIPAGAVANSVAVRTDGLGVIAVESSVKTDPGWLVLFDASRLRVLGALRVGALPDMVALSDNGRVAVVANEAEPSDDYAVDPEGSVSVVRLPASVRHLHVRQSMVRTADFHAFEDALPDGVRVFGPEVNTEFPVSANLEPEYVAISGSTAYVTLQENNAIAVVDLARAKVTRIMPLGYKDWGTTPLDPSDKDGVVDLRTFDGLRGLYMPDSIATYTVRGRTYLVTANEGDAREWGDYVEGARVKDLGDDGLAPICADSPLAGLTGNADLGRLNVTTASGLSADGTCYENLYTFGARSFSIWTTDGELVYDSGSEFEEVTAAAIPDFFNSNHTESGFENRSDDKGPEPEGVSVGKVGGRTYAFVGFERVGGVIVYDVTDPRHASFVTYVNNRDFSVSVEDGGALAAAGDLGPEGVTFLPAGASPSRRPMLAVANEVSGTTTLFSVETSRH